MIWKHHRFQKEFKDTSDSEHRASIYWGTGKATNRPVHISYILCTLTEIIGTRFFFLLPCRLYNNNLPSRAGIKQREKEMEEHKCAWTWWWRVVEAMPTARGPLEASGSEEQMWPLSQHCTEGRTSTGLAGLTVCGSSRMHAPKQPRPRAVLTEWAEDFPVHRFPELSAGMLCLKNSSPSPLCLLYSKVKNIIADAWWPP